MEKPIAFQVHGQTIRGMLHLPESHGRKSPAVLLCHGFTGHRIEAHFLFVKTSRALAENGIASLRFDFRGSGESEGEFREMTVSSEIEDARAALNFLARRRGVDRERLGALGLSLGGCVAACLAGCDSRVRSLALWAAVARPGALCTEPPRQAWAKLVRRHGRLDIGGFDVGRPFIADLPRHNPVESVRRSCAAVLVVHGTADLSVPLDAAEMYLATASDRKARTESFIVKGADHTFSRLEWERMVIERTVAWFRETL